MCCWAIGRRDSESATTLMVMTRPCCRTRCPGCWVEKTRKKEQTEAMPMTTELMTMTETTVTGVTTVTQLTRVTATAALEAA